MSDVKVQFSVVVPVMNEEESIPVLADEITAAMDALPVACECIWVDDGSMDRTREVLRELGGRDCRHRLIAHDCNFGQSAALVSGFSAARGDVLAMLDGDGQNDPADLPGLYARFVAGDADMVNGYRATREDNWVRKVSSRFANGFRNVITREKLRDVGCSIRVFRRECVEDLPVWRGLHRFLPTMARIKGFSLCEVPVNHRPRTQGVTKYGIGNRVWVGLADCFAVRWMSWRLVWPETQSEDERA